MRVIVKLRMLQRMLNKQKADEFEKLFSIESVNMEDSYQAYKQAMKYAIDDNVKFWVDHLSCGTDETYRKAYYIPKEKTVLYDIETMKEFQDIINKYSKHFNMEIITDVNKYTGEVVFKINCIVA